MSMHLLGSIECFTTTFLKFIIPSKLNLYSLNSKAMCVFCLIIMVNHRYMKVNVYASASIITRYIWEQLKPLTRGTSSGLHSSRFQDRCRRLQDVFIEDLLKTSSHLWEQLKPFTRGRLQDYLTSFKSSPRPVQTSSRSLHWRLLEDVFTPLRTIKTVN